jgi:hypothetical protein
LAKLLENLEAKSDAAASSCFNRQFTEHTEDDMQNSYARHNEDFLNEFDIIQDPPAPKKKRVLPKQLSVKNVSQVETKTCGAKKRSLAHGLSKTNLGVAHETEGT